MNFTNSNNFSEALLEAHNNKKRAYKLGTTIIFADGVVIIRKRAGFVRL